MSFNINNIKRKTIKCEICYGELLGDISDIKDSDIRLSILMEFCGLLQEIVRRETIIEMLRNWRKAFKKADKKSKN